MKTDFKKYGIMIIAAVLLVGVVFAGVASAGDGSQANPYTASDWNALDDTAMIALSGNVYIADSDLNAIIYPKYNDTSIYPYGFLIGDNLTLDFTDYMGTFYGEPNAHQKYIGSLFGYVNVSVSDKERTLTIKNLTMRDVVVNASDVYGGGIIGYFQGKSVANSILHFTGCHLYNCTISNNTAGALGGLVACTYPAESLFIDNCTAQYCEVVSSSTSTYSIGGLCGFSINAFITDCDVENCIVSSYRNAGGIFGAGLVNLLRSTVTSSMLTGDYQIGGIIGSSSSNSDIANCTVTNCLVLCSNPTSGNFGGVDGYGDWYPLIVNTTVKNTTVYAFESTVRVQGLLGGAYSVRSGCSGNYLVDSAVRGGRDNASLSSMNCTLENNFLDNNNTLPQPKVSVLIGNDKPDSSLETAIIVTKLSGIGTLNDLQYACGYVIESAPLLFNPGVAGKDAYAGTVKVGAQTINPLCLAGYVFNGWNLSSADGTMVTDAAGLLQNNVPGYTNATGYWNNVSGTTVVLFANLTLNKTEVTATDNKAEFGNDNVTAIRSQDTVSQVLLLDVSNVTNTTVTFTADNTSVSSIPSVEGYSKEEISVFEINATAIGTATFKVTVTFADKATATAKKGNVRFFHYNVSKWEQLTSTIAEQNNANVTYTVETTSFSPFSIGIYTEIPTPAPTPKKHSESKDMGSTIILTEPVTPTPVPTATPAATAVPTIATVKPTAQQTQKSPAPVFGLIVGLGAAAVLLRLRK